MLWNGAVIHMTNLVLTVLIAASGSWLFYRLKIPAGALIGAIIFSATFNIFTDMGAFPAFMKTALQAIAGAFIGQRVTRKDLGELKQTLRAGILMFICMTVYTLLVGKLLSAVTELDLPTALVSAMPAGLSDTAIISGDLGADSTQTTVIHTVRTLFAILLLPQLAFRVCEYLTKNKDALEQERAAARKLDAKPAELRTARNVLITLVLAECFGVLGKLSGIPAGALTFAVFAVAAQNIAKGTAYLPKSLKLAAQCLMGIIVGLGVTMEDVQNMGLLIKPIILVLICTTACNYICAFLMHKLCRLDISTSLFGSIPAGVSDMALIATDLGGDAPKVGVLQLVRYIGLFSVMPLIIKFLTNL